MSTITKINVGGIDYDIGGTEYTAGDGIDISNGELSVKIDGSTITVDSNGVLSAVGGGGSSGNAGTKIVSAEGKTSLQVVTNLSPTYTGNPRGNGAVDLQQFRNSNDQVASGNFSVAMGYNNTAGGYSSVAMGYVNKANGESSIALGAYNTIEKNSSYSLIAGNNNTVNAENAIATGRENNATIPNSVSSNYSPYLGFNEDYPDNKYGNCGFFGLRVGSYKSGDTALFKLDFNSILIARIDIITCDNSGSFIDGPPVVSFNIIVTDCEITKNVNISAGNTSAAEFIRFYVMNNTLYVAFDDMVGRRPIQIGVFYTLCTAMTQGGGNSSGSSSGSSAY